MASPDVDRIPLPPEKPFIRKKKSGKQVTFSSSSHHHHHHHSNKNNPNNKSGDEENSAGSGNKKVNFRSLMRKRSYSFSDAHSRGLANNTKRMRKMDGFSHQGQTLTLKKGSSKFLLGGNIRDPLNLNSLNDEKIARFLNAKTPESSPIPTPQHRKPEYKIEVLIPPNISDPLNLNCVIDEDEEENSHRKYEAQLISPGLQNANPNSAKKRKFRYRKRRFKSCTQKEKSEESENEETELNSSSESLPCPSSKEVIPPKAEEKDDGKKEAEKVAEKECEEKKTTETEKAEPVAKKCLKMDAETKEDKKPQVQQQHQQKQQQRKSGGNNQRSKRNASKRKKKNFRSTNIPLPRQELPETSRFEFGNYDRYYGYRNAAGGGNGIDADCRLKFLKPEWISDKEVLDIGCNVGRITMAIASGFSPKKITGIDIDRNLIERAKKSLREIRSVNKPDGETVFPVNLPQKFGSVSSKLSPTDSESAESSANANANLFPRNVSFVEANYVLDNDDLLEMAQPEFDTIICLSTTKWIHMNFGDEGVKRAFKRMYAQLRPGGILILEAQGTSSYRKKKRLTKKIFENFNNIKLWPEKFPGYLTGEVGFCFGRTIAIPPHPAQGFQRPIQVFYKPLPFSSRTATPYFGPSPYFTPSSPFMPGYRIGGGCYAPSLTPMYNPATPVSTTPVHEKEDGAQSQQPLSPQPGPSGLSSSSRRRDPRLVEPGGEEETEFSRPLDPPADYDNYMGTTPNYSPGAATGQTPSYSGYTAGHSGITPGYSAPSPEIPSPLYGAESSGSPVYSGPDPGAMSNASTPGHQNEGDFVGPGYTPSYAPSNPGTPRTTPLYSPGNATPAQQPSGGNTPAALRTGQPSGAGRSERCEVDGNTTPHPGYSPQNDGNNPRYFWYGGSSSGGNTPQSAHEGPSSPQVYPTHYSEIGAGGDSSSNPATPEGGVQSPADPASPLA